MTLESLCCTLCRKGSLAQLKSPSMIFKIIFYRVLNDQIPCLSHYISFLKEKKKNNGKKKWEWNVPRKHKTGRIIKKGSSVKSKMSVMNDGDCPLAHCHLWRLITSQCKWRTVFYYEIRAHKSARSSSRRGGRSNEK